MISISFSACDKVYTSSRGSITSPNFPGRYPNNAGCHYLIKHWDPAARITLTFHQFSIEGHSKCAYDSVKIYDGKSVNASQFGAPYGYCGSCKPQTLTSTGNAVLIVLVSDGSLAYFGFNVTFKGMSIYVVYKESVPTLNNNSSGSNGRMNSDTFSKAETSSCSAE